MKEDSKEKKIDETKQKVKELKQRHYSNIPDSAEFTKEQRFIVEGLLFDAVDEAFALGGTQNILESVDIKEAINKLEGFYKQMSEPTAATRADKYKQLYYNQRIITAHMQSQIQILQTQIQTMESDGNLFTNVIERMPSIFGASPVMERVDTAFAATNT